MISSLFIITMFGIAIITLVASVMINSHPVFYALMFVVLAFMTWVNAIYSNFYEEFASTNNFGALASNFPIITYVFRWFPLIMLIISIIIVVVMVSKGE